ncbi:MAG: AAA family ATPase [Siculibacillus sp.]|nr:AAA family ATPase [Siculibacillus sp.]
MTRDVPTPRIPGAATATADETDRRVWEEVVHFLGRAATHGLDAPPTRIDTHAAVVFLAGLLAFKIKRPVVFPFLDYSTLARREAACRREIEIDRPIAPEVYRRAVAITRTADGGLAIDGDGVPVEWAVEMNRFDETATLDRVVAKGPLEPSLVDDLAAGVARMRARATPRAAEPWIADLGAYLDQNAEAFATRPDLFPPGAAALLDRRSRMRLADLHDLLVARGRLGFVRLGHGDLHCGNIAVIDGRAVPFDAIEFDDAIATGDLLYDAGFLVMDLADRGDRAAARRFLDRLLLEAARREAEARIHDGAPAVAATRATVLLDEIDGLAALDLFLSIRAALRAKIAAARAPHLAGAARAETEAEARRLFGHAVDHITARMPRLVAIGGLSGSGKSRLAIGLAPELEPSPGAVVLRSDEIRKLLAGVAPTARLPAADYTREASSVVYDVLARVAGGALAAGRSVIVDAVSARPDERARFAAIAARVEVPFTGIWLDVDAEVAASRVGARRGDASDADAAVARAQHGWNTGAIDWARVDANGTPEATLAAVRELVAPVT